MGDILIVNRVPRTRSIMFRVLKNIKRNIVSLIPKNIKNGIASGEIITKNVSKNTENHSATTIKNIWLINRL